MFLAPAVLSSLDIQLHNMEHPKRTSKWELGFPKSIISDVQVRDTSIKEFRKFYYSMYFITLGNRQDGIKERERNKVQGDIDKLGVYTERGS